MDRSENISRINNLFRGNPQQARPPNRPDRLPPQQQQHQQQQNNNAYPGVIQDHVSAYEYPEMSGSGYPQGNGGQSSGGQRYGGRDTGGQGYGGRGSGNDDEYPEMSGSGNIDEYPEMSGSGYPQAYGGQGSGNTNYTVEGDGVTQRPYPPTTVQPKRTRTPKKTTHILNFTFPAKTRDIRRTTTTARHDFEGSTMTRQQTIVAGDHSVLNSGQYAHKYMYIYIYIYIYIQCILYTRNIYLYISIIMVFRYDIFQFHCSL